MQVTSSKHQCYINLRILNERSVQSSSASRMATGYWTDLSMSAVGKRTWIGKDFEQEESERHFVCLSGKTALYCCIAVLAYIQYGMELINIYL